MIAEENNKKVNNLESEYNERMKDKELVAQQKVKSTIYLGLVIILLLITIIAFLTLRLQKNRLKIRAAEIDLLIGKLERKNKELTENAIQMHQTSEIIDSTHRELADLKDVSNIQTRSMLSKIISDLKSGAKGFHKEEFEKLFKETNEAFYTKLISKHPDLTKNEIRLSAFAKMNLSVKEISAITQQSPNSIITARYRLRKKLNLHDGESLTNYLIKM